MVNGKAGETPLDLARIYGKRWNYGKAIYLDEPCWSNEEVDALVERMGHGHSSKV